MRLFVLCTVAGGVVVAVALTDRPAATVLAALVVACLVYAAWFVGHEQGWDARRDHHDHHCTLTVTREDRT